MKEQLEQRLLELQAEYNKGEKRLEKLEEERESLRMALLRISGAIQVLEEELGKAAKVLEMEDTGENGVEGDKGGGEREG